MIRKLRQFYQIKNLQAIIRLNLIFVLGILIINKRWRPNTNFEGSPIPTRFDYDDSKMSIVLQGSQDNIVYYGFRAQDSLSFHETFSRQRAYPFKLPSKSAYMLINIIRNYPRAQKTNNHPLGTPESYKDDKYIFDSCFEGGNLDVVVKSKDNEYDLYMRDDSNTRGHHQWFYFSIQTKVQGTIKLNLVNFSKRNSLYTQGMRVAIFSTKKAKKANKGELPKLYSNWHKGGENIVYKLSKLSQELYSKGKIM